MITLKNIVKVFDDRGVAGLHGLTLDLHKGKVLALMGPNGSGKSTLLNIINGNLMPDSGEINLLGAAFLVKDNQDIQDINVLKFLIHAIKKDIVDEKKVQLARDFADIFEFTFQLRQSTSELSQGQKQKVILCADLINCPEIILLDEPFNHLDPFSRRDILKGLFKYIRQNDLSVLWVTHDKNDAFYFADSIGILNFGKLEQLASPEEMMFNPKNLFVARFLGHHNFILCKRLSDQSWSTPWGEWEHKDQIKADEAILVVPAYAWQLGDAGIDVKIHSIRAHELQWAVEFSWNSQSFIAHLPIAKELPLDFSGIKFKPLLENCFLIPL